MKKVLVGMFALVMCAGMAMAAGTCPIHGITYYSDVCPSCAQDNANRVKKQNDDCETWKKQSQQEIKGTTKTQKQEQQKQKDEAKEKFDTWCVPKN